MIVQKIMESQACMLWLLSRHSGHLLDTFRLNISLCCEDALPPFCRYQVTVDVETIYRISLVINSLSAVKHSLFWSVLSTKGQCNFIF